MMVVAQRENGGSYCTQGGPGTTGGLSWQIRPGAKAGFDGKFHPFLTFLVLAAAGASSPNAFSTLATKTGSLPRCARFSAEA